MAHMKWWGWGDEHVAFHHEDKPKLAPFILEHIDIDVEVKPPERRSLEDMGVPRAAELGGLGESLQQVVGAEHVRTSDLERVVHGFGKSLRDLVMVRAGRFGRLPDAVVYPEAESEVERVVRACIEANAVLIAFGGGTNIAGSLSAQPDEQRLVVSLDLSRMNKVIEIDETSRLARVQAGALGPDMETQLEAKGWTAGHFPDSFRHSSVGGWVATRSSGMQSDKYGDIADITRAVRVVTPNGMLHTRPVPSTSTGPSVREMILGSEGRLGVITEVTIQVHRKPEARKILGYLFPNFEAGLAAMADIAAHTDVSPSVTRVSDTAETRFSFATGKAGSATDRLKKKALQSYLKKRKGFDVANMCLSFIGYEGSDAHVKHQRKLVGKIVADHGGVSVGSGPGALYDQKKFDTPYIRDFLLDRGGLADVSETSAPWSKLASMHSGVVQAANKAFAEIGVKGWIMCHLSHSYHGGACLYFTFAFKGPGDRDHVEAYDVVKSAVQQAFIDNGGTLSHHHAVGTEHARWLSEDISPAGVAMVRALVEGVDPANNLNPGKIYPS